jgi:hypothetical protein
LKQFNSGLPDFFGTTDQNEKNIPSNNKIYQTATKSNNGRKIDQNGHKIDQHLPLQGPPKFTQFGTFGLKICHLATLIQVSSMRRL